MKVQAAHSAYFNQFGVGFTQTRGENSRNIDDNECKAIPVLLSEGGEVLSGEMKQLGVGPGTHRG